MEPVKVSICCLFPAYGFIINKKILSLHEDHVQFWKKGMNIELASFKPTFWQVYIQMNMTKK